MPVPPPNLKIPSGWVLPVKFRMFEGRSNPERYFKIMLYCLCSAKKEIELEQRSYNAWKRGEYPASVLFPEVSKLDRRFLVTGKCPKCR